MAEYFITTGPVVIKLERKRGLTSTRWSSDQVDVSDAKKEVYEVLGVELVIGHSCLLGPSISSELEEWGGKLAGQPPPETEMFGPSRLLPRRHAAVNEKLASVCNSYPG